MLHENSQCVRESQHSHRRTRRRAIDNTDIEVTRLLDLVNGSQGDELFDPGKRQKLFRYEFVGFFPY